MMGEVVVDDLGQLMAFSTCFDFEAVACCSGRRKNVAGLPAAKEESASLAAVQPRPAEAEDTIDLGEQFPFSALAIETEPGLLLV